MRLIISILCILWVGCSFANGIVGKWNTFDKTTGKISSEVDIYIVDNKYFGKIIKIHNSASGEENPLCTKCPGIYKDKPILGMVMLMNMRRSTEGLEGGKVIDPVNGYIADCTIAYDPNTPDQLQVTGQVAFIKRTVIWKRVKQ